MTKGLIHILANDSGVQALVGNKQSANTSEYKIFPVAVPQAEKPPYIVCKMIGNPPTDQKVERATLFTPRVAVMCYTQNYDDCITLENAVIDALDKKKGQHNNIQFALIVYADSSEGFINTDGLGLYVRVPIFECLVNESDPT